MEKEKIQRELYIQKETKKKQVNGKHANTASAGAAEQREKSTSMMYVN